MARKSTRKPPVDDTPKGFYDETKVEWSEVAPDVFNAVNLAEPDSATVCRARLPGGVLRWMFRASNGQPVRNTNGVFVYPEGVLVERQISEIGDAPIIVNAFAAQQLAIQWLNKRRAEAVVPVEIAESENDPAVVYEAVFGGNSHAPAEVHELGGITNLSIVPPEPVIVGVDTAQPGSTVLSEWFPRDTFTGQPIEGYVAPPAPPPPEPEPPDPDDEPIDPQPVKRGRKRQ